MLRTERLTIVTAGVAALLALVVLLAWSGNPATAQAAASGATITVNTAADVSKPDGDCSLREAIRAADTNTAVDACAAGRARSDDTIQFSLGRRATVFLKRTLPPVTARSGLTIFGGEEAKIVVSGDDKVRVLVVRRNARLDLRNITVADGFANGDSDGGQIGGAIKNNGGTLRVFRSTISANNAVDIGGGIANIGGGTLKVKNSTFAGNKAGSAGGGILNDGTLDLTYTTFYDNDAELVGGGIQNANNERATTTLENTVLAKSANGNLNNVCAGGQCRGKIVDGGYNISDDASHRFTTQTSKSRTDPKFALNGLQDNGGPTPTVSLRSTSPAINFIPKSTNGCGTTTSIDQRGVKRPKDHRCDAGALEKVLRP
jgi:CSLREA domain-containing protein